MTAAQHPMPDASGANDAQKESHQLGVTQMGGSIDAASIDKKLQARAPQPTQINKSVSMEDFLSRLAKAAVLGALKQRHGATATPEVKMDDRTADWVKSLIARLLRDPQLDRLFFPGIDVALKEQAATAENARAAAVPEREFERLTRELLHGNEAAASQVRTSAPRPASTRPSVAAPVPPVTEGDPSPEAPIAEDAIAPLPLPADTVPVDPPEAGQGERKALARTALAKAMTEVHGRYGRKGLNEFRSFLQQQNPEALPLFTELLPQYPDNAATATQADGRPLVGGFEEIALQGSSILREHPSDPAFSTRFATSTLAATLRRLEDDQLDGERQVDLLIHWFAGEHVYRNGRRPTASKAFREVLNRIRARLLMPAHAASEAEADGADEDGPSPALTQRKVLGRLETFTNLVTWYGMADGDERERLACRLCACDAGLQLLPEFLQAQADPSRLGRMISQIANNLAGWVGDVLDVKRDEDYMSNKTGKRLNSLHALATSAHLRQPQSGRWSDKASALFSALGVPHAPKDPEASARALLFMCNIPSAWRVAGPVLEPVGAPPEVLADSKANARFRTAVLSAMSAVMRAQFNPSKDDNEISSALFNLGVDVMLIGRTGISVDRRAVLRVMANALGLFWAIARAGGDDRRLLVVLNGGDCAVNLMGALADPQVREFVGRAPCFDLVRELGEQLIAGVQSHQLLPMTQRLRGSYRTIFGDDQQPTATRFSIAEIRNLITRLMALTIVQWSSVGGRNERQDGPMAALDLPGLGSDGLPTAMEIDRHLETDFADCSARILRWTFENLLLNGETLMAPSYIAVSSWWLQVTDLIADRAKEPDYKRFIGLVPTELTGWDVKEQVEQYTGPKDEHLLSRTLADAQLMGAFFDA